MSEIIKPIEQRVAEAVQCKADPLDWASRIMGQIEQTNPRIRDGLKKRFEEVYWPCVLGNKQEILLPEQGVIYNAIPAPDNGSGPSNSQRHVDGLAQLPLEDRILYLERRRTRNGSFNDEKRSKKERNRRQRT